MRREKARTAEWVRGREGGGGGDLAGSPEDLNFHTEGGGTKEVGTTLDLSKCGGCVLGVPPRGGRTPAGPHWLLLQGKKPQMQSFRKLLSFVKWAINSNIFKTF